jgi:FAD synthetase
MGNRLTDPYSSELKPIEKSSPGWPEFTRVFPVLNWDYNTVWQFLRVLQLPYCKLYDLGFTSLGEKHYSSPNPHLQTENGSFKPAYELSDGLLERLSRH